MPSQASPQALEALQAAIRGQTNAQISHLFGRRAPAVKIKDAVLAIERTALVKKGRYGYVGYVGSVGVNCIANNHAEWETANDAWLQVAIFVRNAAMAATDPTAQPS